MTRGGEKMTELEIRLKKLDFGLKGETDKFVVYLAKKSEKCFPFDFVVKIPKSFDSSRGIFRYLGDNRKNALETLETLLNEAITKETDRIRLQILDFFLNVIILEKQKLIVEQKRENVKNYLCSYPIIIKKEEKIQFYRPKPKGFVETRGAKPKG